MNQSAFSNPKQVKMHRHSTLISSGVPKKHAIVGGISPSPSKQLNEKIWDRYLSNGNSYFSQSITQKNIHLRSRSFYHSIIKSQYQGSSELNTMLKESSSIGQTIKGKGDKNFCEGQAQIQVQQPPYDCRFDLPYNREHRNSNMLTSSIFEGRDRDPNLEEMIKIKKKATPTQQQTQIRQLTQAFKAYTKKQPVDKDEQINQNHHAIKPSSSRVKQSFESFIFYNTLKEKTILFIKITPTRDKKCNITVFNLLGQVLQYFPNIYETKKVGKIIKFAKNNPLAQIIVVEYVEKIENEYSYLSLTEESGILCCFFPILKKQQTEKLMIQTRKEIYRKIISSNEGQLLLFSQGLFLQQNNQLQNILSIITKINSEQNQFLLNFRGHKPPQQIIIAFDSMAINLWRQYNLVETALVYKINSVFKMEEVQRQQLQVREPSVLHTPKRLKLSKNCSQCKINQPEKKRPKRTYFVCSSCSVNRDPMYLCKNCFRTHRRSSNQTSGAPPQEHQKGIAPINIIQNERRRTESLLASLDKCCGQYLSKVEELIEERGFSSAEYYLQHLLNLSILKTTAFLKKKGQSKTEQIKLQH